MENNESRSSLATLLGVIRSRLLIILAIGVACAVVFALVTKFFIAPQYSSVAKFYVNNNKKADNQTGVSQQDINASQSLAETSIVYIRNSGKLLQAVLDEAGSDRTTGELKKMITTGTYSSTEFFYVSVSAPSPEEALELAQAFDKVIPEKIPETVMGAVIKTADDPRLPTDQDSPNLVLNTLVGALLGVVISLLIFFLREVLDSTVYDEDDIKDAFGYPVIGVIPTISGDAPQVSSGRRKSKKEAK